MRHFGAQLARTGINWQEMYCTCSKHNSERGDETMQDIKIQGRDRWIFARVEFQMLILT